MRFFVPVAFIILLNGCESIAGAEGATTWATGKTLSDHVISIVSGKHCSSVRVNNGQNYCAEDDIAAPQNINCYRTLGKVTCYDVPNPYGGKQRKVGENATSLPKKKNPTRFFR